MKYLTILVEPNINTCNCQKLLYLPQNSLLSVIQTVVPVKTYCLFDKLNKAIDTLKYDKLIIFIKSTELTLPNMYANLHMSIYYRNYGNIKTKGYNFLLPAEMIEFYHILIQECFQSLLNKDFYIENKRIFNKHMGNDFSANDFDKYINPILYYHSNISTNLNVCKNSIKNNVLYIPYLPLFDNHWMINIII